MQSCLFRPILIGSAIACFATEILVLSVAKPADISTAFLGGLWLAMPYLLACGIAYLFRSHRPALLSLIICLGLAAFAGLSVTVSASAQQRQAERDVQNAVLPGEDPHSGPAGMRKTGAEFGASIGWGVMIVLALVVSPIQSTVILIPTLIVRAVAGSNPEAASTEAYANVSRASVSPGGL